MEKPEDVAKLIDSKKILILGSSGSGKTTLAIQLSRILNLDVVHLDARFWRPGWHSTPQEEWQATVAQLAARPSWIMDGTYERSLHLRIPAADALIVLERSRMACLWRVIKRKLTINDEHRPDAPPGQPLDWPFIRYVWHYPRVTRPIVYEFIRQYGLEKSLIVLKGPTEPAQLVQGLDREVRRRRR